MKKLLSNHKSEFDTELFEIKVTDYKPIKKPFKPRQKRKGLVERFRDGLRSFLGDDSSYELP